MSGSFSSSLLASPVVDVIVDIVFRRLNLVKIASPAKLALGERDVDKLPGGGSADLVLRMGDRAMEIRRQPTVGVPKETAFDVVIDPSWNLQYHAVPIEETVAESKRD